MIAKCFSFLCLVVGWVTLFTFWGGLVFGHFYFGYSMNGLDEASWTCFAPQDKSVTVPWPGPKEDVPDNYHNVSDDFQLCARFGFYTYLMVTLTLLCI